MMKTLAAATLLLSALDPLCAQTVQADPVAATGAPVRTLTISRSGTRPPTQGPAENFTGSVWVDPLFVPVEPTRAAGSNVTFSPGARTAWHTHPLGQTLVVTAGVGRVQTWGGPVEEIRPGDVIRIPPNTKHWHGAAPDSAMTHLSIVERLDGKSADWLEKVSDAQYRSATTPAATSNATPGVPTQPSRAQQLMGDIAPKLADLTDNVLFGDVWARPGLSRRDRSLATVSALIAMNRPDQLRSHLALARQNGLTQEELVEAITHLAFYAGWPSGVSAAMVAKEVFAKP